ncbi:MAG TPA: carboxyltransferase domain-containing protein, partial [Nocardioidaceae bacterium]|nr:carboxyltransferase domain-containing protein [Nocardioidaceae bacterium]
MKALRCGDAAVLLEVDDLDAVLRLHAGLVAADLPGVTDIVPAARTVLARFDPAVTSADAVVRVARSGGAVAP